MLTGNGPWSLRAYAKHRGVSVEAVSKAVKKGRLVRSVVVVAGAPKIANWELADQEWTANTDLSKAPGSVKARAASTSSTGAVVDAAHQARIPSAVTDLSRASAREKNARAGLVELEYQEKAGRLVSAGRVEAGFTDMVTAAREALMGVPSKCKARIPHLTNSELAIVHEEVCKALEQLADRRRSGAAA